MLAPLLGGLIGLGLFVLARKALIDDAYITLDYARSLAFHGQWALEPGHQANTATSPLNVLLLAAFSLVTRDPILAAGFVLVLSMALLGWALSAIGNRHGRPLSLPVIGVAAVAVCPLLASTVGMETYLAVALIACLGCTVLYRRPVAAGVVIGLLVLTRPDLAAFGVAAVLTPALVKKSPAVIGIAVGVTLPWFIISWLVLGSALPDTVLLKVGDHWGPWTFVNGLLLYEAIYPAAVLLSVIAAAAGVVAAVAVIAARFIRRSGPDLALAIVWGLGAGLHAGVYVLLGTAPYHWYYGPAIGALTLLGVMSLSSTPKAVWWIGSIAAWALIIVSGAFLLRLPWDTVPITTNWATSEQYAVAAASVPSGAVVRSPGEIGTLAYYCDCTIVDGFSDRALIARALVDRMAVSGPMKRAIFGLNYANLQTGTPLDPTMEFVFADSGPGLRTSTPWRVTGALRLEPVVPVGVPS